MKPQYLAAFAACFLAMCTRKSGPAQCLKTIDSIQKNTLEIPQQDENTVFGGGYLRLVLPVNEEQHDQGTPDLKAFEGSEYANTIDSKNKTVSLTPMRLSLTKTSDPLFPYSVTIFTHSYLNENIGKALHAELSVIVPELRKLTTEKEIEAANKALGIIPTPEFDPSKVVKFGDNIIATVSTDKIQYQKTLGTKEIYEVLKQTTLNLKIKGAKMMRYQSARFHPGDSGEEPLKQTTRNDIFAFVFDSNFVNLGSFYHIDNSIPKPFDTPNFCNNVKNNNRNGYGSNTGPLCSPFFLTEPVNFAVIPDLFPAEKVPAGMDPAKTSTADVVFWVLKKFAAPKQQNAKKPLPAQLEASLIKLNLLTHMFQSENDLFPLNNLYYVLKQRDCTKLTDEEVTAKSYCEEKQKKIAHRVIFDSLIFYDWKGNLIDKTGQNGLIKYLTRGINTKGAFAPIVEELSKFEQEIEAMSDQYRGAADSGLKYPNKFPLIAGEGTNLELLNTLGLEIEKEFLDKVAEITTDQAKDSKKLNALYQTWLANLNSTLKDLENDVLKVSFARLYAIIFLEAQYYNDIAEYLHTHADGIPLHLESTWISHPLKINKDTIIGYYKFPLNLSALQEKELYPETNLIKNLYDLDKYPTPQNEIMLNNKKSFFFYTKYNEPFPCDSGSSLACQGAGALQWQFTKEYSSLVNFIWGEQHSNALVIGDRYVLNMPFSRGILKLFFDGGAMTVAQGYVVPDEPTPNGKIESTPIAGSSEPKSNDTAGGEPNSPPSQASCR